MTSAYRFAAAAMAALLLAPPASADSNPQPTQISINYHEMIAAGADTAPVFLSIFDRLRQDCELIGKAFARKCVITQINININANYGDMNSPRNLNANATITLPPGPIEISPSPAPAPAPR